MLVRTREEINICYKIGCQHFCPSIDTDRGGMMDVKSLWGFFC